MYQFSNWCFLCAKEDNADIEIQTLDVEIRESIGQFSLINFTLTGVPSKICAGCHIFLKDFERRKERYAKAEQMYMELIKMRNKSVDIKLVRLKYELAEAETVVQEAPANEAEYFEVVEIDVKQSTRNIFEIPQETTKMSTRRSQYAPSTPPPKILNPTILAKIQSVVRLDLFKCDKCSHSSSTKTSIERHMKQIHLQQSPKSFSCSTCNKTFSRKIVLQNHEKIHLAQRPTFDCPHCGKALSSQTAVRNHVSWVHKESREFACRICTKQFATKGALHEHEKIHSDHKGHICSICQKSYKTASTLTQHLDTHGETEYFCSICNLRLNSKRTLRQHMVKHSDIVRFTCEVCNAQFKRTKAYKEHLISQHTEIKAYKCDWCSKLFSNGANCRKHKKEAHPKELDEADKTQDKKIVRLPKIDELLSMSLT